MSLVKSLSHFWNVTLGVDCPEDVEIKSNGTIEMEELQESLRRVDVMEKKLTSTGNKAGKGGKSSKLDVPTATIDSKQAVKTAQKKAGKEQDVENER